MRKASTKNYHVYPDPSQQKAVHYASVADLMFDTTPLRRRREKLVQNLQQFIQLTALSSKRADAAQTLVRASSNAPHAVSRSNVNIGVISRKPR